MKEKIREILTIKRGVVYGDFPGLIADLEHLVNQEVVKRIAGVMPSIEVDDDHIPYPAKPSLFKFHQKIGFIRGWRAAMTEVRSRLTNQKTDNLKENNNNGSTN